MAGIRSSQPSCNSCKTEKASGLEWHTLASHRPLAEIFVDHKFPDARRSITTSASVVGTAIPGSERTPITQLMAHNRVGVRRTSASDSYIRETATADIKPWLVFVALPVLPRQVLRLFLDLNLPKTKYIDQAFLVHFKHNRIDRPNGRWIDERKRTAKCEAGMSEIIPFENGRRSTQATSTFVLKLKFFAARPELGHCRAYVIPSLTVSFHHPRGHPPPPTAVGPPPAAPYPPAHRPKCSAPSSGLLSSSHSPSSPPLRPRATPNPLHPPPTPGTLRRFRPNSTQNLVEVLRIAQNQRMGFMVLGPQHAREWVATSTALYIAHALLAPANETGSLAHLLKVYDFHILPTPNPDGYVHTWESDRFWDKNRQVVGPNAACVGIDMNCERERERERLPLLSFVSRRLLLLLFLSLFAPEVNTVGNYITKVNGIGKGAGKEGPGGKRAKELWTDVCHAVLVQMRQAAEGRGGPDGGAPRRGVGGAEGCMGRGLRCDPSRSSLGGLVYQSMLILTQTGTLCELLYRAPGNLFDYVYSAASIKYSYAAFLRDTGTYGFALPPAWIRPVGEETGVMVEYLARFIARQKAVDL
ncbi:hypothetical protein B0H11DRAFT_1921815 [Mycena galericulata]|nr:hypothetical protein B0H11DRAFT_1921815 [Mycena galericulata]